MAREASEADDASLEDDPSDAQDDAELGDGSAPGEMQESLGVAAAGLAEQLQFITEEMNNIRQELYGDAGIGGIARELERLKASGLADVLGANGLDGLDGLLQDGGAAGDGERDKMPSQAATSSRASGQDTRQAESVSRRDGVRPSKQKASDFQDRLRKNAQMQELQQRIAARKQAEAEEQSSVNLRDKLIMLFVLLLALYIAWPSFHAMVNEAVLSVVLDADTEADEVQEFEF
mmetsp:Transcript_30121/g.54948  ORF Transcript_30121/g.54948 Transcript_30121/m.54948 type:complete len:234 (+) Transcript_30121:81-782(+)